MTWQEENTLRKQGTLREFANLRKQRTGLPVNIWVDDGMSYIQGGHSKRIKFQLNYNDSINSRDNSEMACMTLDGNIVESTIRGKDIEISKSDINKVSNFVKNNQYALSYMSDMKIDILDFCDVLIKGGEKASKEQIDIQISSINQILITVDAFAPKEEVERFLK